MQSAHDIIDTLKGYRTDGKLIPFIGAGFSTNVDKYPDWNNFVLFLEAYLNVQLPEKICFRDMFRNDPAECTQYFYWRAGYSEQLSVNDCLVRGKHIFRDLVFRTFKPPDYDSNTYSQHEELIRKFERIYTTNWDDLLEQTCLKIREQFGYEKYYSPLKSSANTIYWGGREYRKAVEPSLIGNEKRIIIKFHGCQEDHSCTSLIASTADFL